MNDLTPFQINQALAGILALAVFYIVILHVRLRKERAKRLFPLVTIEVNPKDARIYIKNISSTPAKDIRVGDIDFILGYEFQKELTLKFETLELLPGEHGAMMNYKVFEGDHEFRHSHADNVLAHLAGAEFEATVDYKNLENTPFVTTLHKKGNSFKIKDSTMKKK